MPVRLLSSAAIASWSGLADDDMILRSVISRQKTCVLKVASSEHSSEGSGRAVQSDSWGSPQAFHTRHPSLTNHRCDDIRAHQVPTLEDVPVIRHCSSRDYPEPLDSTLLWRARTAGQTLLHLL